MNVFASMNQELDIVTAQKVAEKFGYSLVLAKKPIKEKKHQTQKKVHNQKKGTRHLLSMHQLCVFLGMPEQN